MAPTNTQTTDKLVNEFVAADMLGLSPSWLRQHRVKGTGPRFIKLGRAVRYRIGDLTAYIEARSVGADHAVA